MIILPLAKKWPLTSKITKFSTNISSHFSQITSRAKRELCFATIVLNSLTLKSPKMEGKGGKGKGKGSDNANANQDGEEEGAETLEQQHPSKPPPRRSTRSATARRCQNQVANQQQPNFLKPTKSSSARRQEVAPSREIPFASQASQKEGPRKPRCPVAAAAASSSAAMSRGRGRGDDASAGGHSDTATTGLNRQHDNDSVEEDNDNGDPQLQRLLLRLRREHATNFGKNSNDNNRGSNHRGVNRTRARYLLEASAGECVVLGGLFGRAGRAG